MTCKNQGWIVSSHPWPKKVRAYVQNCKLHQCFSFASPILKQGITKKKNPPLKKAYGVAVMLCPIAGQLVLNDRVK